MPNKVKIILISALIVLAGFLPVAQKAQAIPVEVTATVPIPAVIAPTTTAINLKSFALEIAKSFAVSMLENTTDRFVSMFINKAISKFKIGNILGYTRNLANQVYLASQLKSQSQTDQYIARSIIDDYNQLPVKHKPLDSLYTQKALQTMNIYDVNQVPSGVQTYAFLAKASDPATDPHYQKLLAQDKASNYYAQSQTAASKDITQGNGYKSDYTCPKNLGGTTGNGIVVTVTDENGDVGQGTDLVASKVDPRYLAAEPDNSGGNIPVVGTSLEDANYLNPDANGQEHLNTIVAPPPDNRIIRLATVRMSTTSNTTQVAGEVACIVQNPANYVTSTINAHLNSLFNRDKAPADHVQAIARAIGDTLGKVLSNQLLNAGTKKASLFGDVASAGAQALHAIVQSKAKFTVYDSQGNYLGQAGDKIPFLLNQDAVTFNWNATGLIDAKKVTFSFGNLERDFTQIVGTNKLTISNYGDYTLEVFIVDQSGQLVSGDKETITFVAPANSATSNPTGP
jgi:hypothetical protein